MKTLAEGERAKVIAALSEEEKSEAIGELLEDWYQLRLTVAHIHPCGDEHIDFHSKGELEWICPLCGVDFLNDTIDDMIPKIMTGLSQKPLVAVNQSRAMQ